MDTQYTNKTVLAALKEQ